jgi:toxin secretion/phage lysis holin
MNNVKFTLGAIGAGLAYIFGSLDAMLITLIIFICIDFLSGFIRAWAKKEFDSSKFYIGGVKKFGILLIVAVATQLDKLVLGDNVILRSVAISYYIANEGFSILENWGGLGLPLPKALRNALAKLKQDGDDDDNQ